MYAAKVLVVSLRPPAFSPPSFLFSLHGNNLVIDDVKADEIQQLEKPQVKEQNGWVFSFYGCLWFVYHHCLQPITTQENTFGKPLVERSKFIKNQSPFFIQTSLQMIFISHT